MAKNRSPEAMSLWGPEAYTVEIRCLRCPSLLSGVRRIGRQWVNGRHRSVSGARQPLRAEPEEFAAGENRKLGNPGEQMLEWAFEQLKDTGYTQNLLKYGIRRHGHRVQHCN